MIREVHYFPALPTAEDAAALAQLADTFPGVKVYKEKIVAPANAAWLVEQALAQMRVAAKDRSVPPTPPRLYDEEVFTSIPELQPWVPAFLAGYQRSGVLFALNAPSESATLWHSTGSGKTLSAIVWLLANPGHCLFVTKAAARKTIQREFERYTTVRPFVLRPLGELRKGERAEREAFEETLKTRENLPRVVIVGWESLPSLMDKLLHFPITSIVFDEIHKAKSWRRFRAVPVIGDSGQDEKRFERLDNIVANAARLSANAKRRLGLTATPIADRQRDLWGQLDLVHPGAWGRPWKWFARYAGLSMNQWGGWDNSGRSNVEELKQRLSFVVHKVDYSVTHRELPPKRRQTVFLSKADQNPPSAFARELSRARKLGALHLQEVRIAEAASRKRNYVVEMVDDDVRSGQKVVVFTARRNDVERLEKVLGDTLPAGTPIWALHGGSGIDARDAAREAFMASERGVLIGTGDAWGESVSLHTANHAIFAMLPITPKQLWQWEGRFHRRGQRAAVLITYVIAEGTYDEHIHGILLSKLPAVDDLQGDSALAEAHQDLRGQEEEITQRLLKAVMEDDEDLKELEEEER